MSERELTSTEAMFQIMRTIQILGFSAAARYTAPTKLVATADLYDSDNNVVESGAGKGPDSLIGALAESIEHFSTFQPAVESTWQSTEAVAMQQEASLDGIIKSLPQGEPIECLRLISLNERDELLVPSALLSPGIAQASYQGNCHAMQFLARYSSNSGIAFGCTKNEALLHGTQELIERHILSLFFMAVCGIGPKMDFYSPSLSLLREALLNDPLAIERARALQVIIIKDVMSVYFAVAFSRAGPGSYHLSPIGSGCSLDIGTAIQRAVTEQFQSQDLYDSNEESLDKKTLDLLSCSNSLKNLIDFAPVRLLKLPELQPSTFRCVATVSSQLGTLRKALADSGKKIFHRTVASFSTNCIVTQAYIPGLERFNIIRNGRLVVPQHILRSN